MTYIHSLNVLGLWGFSLLSFQMQVFYIKNKKHFYVLVVASGWQLVNSQNKMDFLRQQPHCALVFSTPFCTRFQVRVSVTSIM